jgi:hypothetical protein
VQGQYLIAHELLAYWIQSSRRFIKQEQGGIAQQRLSQTQPLQHSSRTSTQSPVGDLAELKLQKQPIQGTLPGSRAKAHQPSHRVEVAPNRQTRWIESPFGQVTDAGWMQITALDLPFIGEDEAHDQPKQRSLASTVRSEKAIYGSGRYL